MKRNYKVRIKNNLQKTALKFGLPTRMLSMAGKTYTVLREISNGVVVKYDDSHSFTFHNDDIEIPFIEEKEYIKVLFNPKKLNI